MKTLVQSKMVEVDFWYKLIEYLGHVISEDRVMLDSAKIKAIEDGPAPIY